MSAPVRRLATFLAAPIAAVPMLLGGGTALGDTSTLFGHEVPAVGATVDDVVVVPGLLTAQHLTVTDTAEGVISADAQLQVGSEPMPLVADLTYTDEQNWSFRIARRAAGPGYRPTSGTEADLNDIRGTVTMDDGHRVTDLDLLDFAIGDYEGDIPLRLAPDGLEGTVRLASLDLGDDEFRDVRLQVSTATPKAEITGTMVSDVGTFDTRVLAQGPLPADEQQKCLKTAQGECVRWRYDGPRKPRYRQELTVSDANLGFAKANSWFELDKVALRTVFTGHTYTCDPWRAVLDADMRMRDTAMDFTDGVIGMACGRLETFTFVVPVSHTDPVSDITQTADLRVAWRGTAGTGVFPGPYRQDGKIRGRATTLRYTQGLFGEADLSTTRRFRDQFTDWYGKTKRWDMTIRINLKFQFAAYQRGDRMPWEVALGMGGNLSGGRTRGEIGCYFAAPTGLESNCGVGFSVDPKFAGTSPWHWVV